MPDYIGEIIMRSGDTVPLLAVAVEDDMGVPLDLTGATSVDLMLTNEDGEDPRAMVTGPIQPQLVLPGSVIDPVNGLVTYDWALDLVLRPGVVQLVVVAHFPTGPISAPSDRTASITVRPDALLPPGGPVPFRYDLVTYRGDSYTWQFRLWQDQGKTIAVDLTGSSAAAQIRDKPGGTQVAPLDCTITLPNVVNMSLAPANSQKSPDQGVWDLQITFAGGQVYTAVSGTVTTTPDVTVLR